MQQVTDKPNNYQYHFEVHSRYKYMILYIALLGPYSIIRLSAWSRFAVLLTAKDFMSQTASASWGK